MKDNFVKKIYLGHIIFCKKNYIWYYYKMGDGDFGNITVIMKESMSKNSYSVTLKDDWGDGWNGHTLKLRDTNDIIRHELGGEFTEGTEYNTTLLLNRDLFGTTIKIEVNGGLYLYEVSWKIESWTGQSIEGQKDQTIHSVNYIFNADGTFTST